MVIVFVTDSFCNASNGTSKTASRFVESLRARGHEVRVLAVGDPAPDNYYVEESNWGPVSYIGHGNSFDFAKYKEDTVLRALDGADVVHCLLPLPFEWKVFQTAKRLGIPSTAAFHMQPENVTYIMHLNKIKGADIAFYRLFKNAFYHNFDYIHCPSKFIAGELKKNGFKGNLYVISNGVDSDFVPPEEYREPDENCYKILMTGRLSPEKCQSTLIKAMKYSKYADKIQIYFAGYGHMDKHLMALGKNIPNPPIIDFYKQDELINLIHSCDLYVHTATVEIEAIACLEAIACGLVPVICNSDKSATVQFAKDPRSLFKNNDPKDLARRIDYWIEHPEEKKKMSKYYAEYGNSFRVEDSVKKIEVMFRNAIRDFKKGGC